MRCRWHLIIVVMPLSKTASDSIRCLLVLCGLQWDLICGKSVLAQLVNSAFFVGYLIGSGVFGSMADKRGRRKTLLLALGTCCF